MRPHHDFLTALGFLTRIAPPRGTTATDIAPAMAYMPLVGLVVGIIAVLPTLIPALAMHSWVQAWGTVILIIYLTRGLHWDAWADIWDGWGSGATGDRFWTIVKDSHVGAFGVIGLVIGIAGQTLLIREVLTTHAAGTVAFSLVMGRANAVYLAAAGKHLARPGLGQAFLLGATPANITIATLTTLVCAFFLINFTTLLWAAALCAVCTLALLRQAKRQHGLNGDFLGCAIIAGELATLLGALLAG